MVYNIAKKAVTRPIFIAGRFFAASSFPRHYAEQTANARLSWLLLCARFAFHMDGDGRKRHLVAIGRATRRCTHL
jgi:hypothetical protein